MVPIQLETLFPPEPHTNPIFIDVENDHIVVPQVLYKEKPKSTPGNEPSTSAVEPVPTESSNYTDEAA